MRHPEALLLFLPWGALLWRMIRRRPLTREVLPMATLSWLGPVTSGRWTAWGERVCRLLAIAALIVALSGPEGPGKRTDSVRMGIDVMLALDLSGSMRAEDFQPDNRLEVARRVLRDFVSRSPEHRIGLVAFAGRSVTLCPLTTDHAALLSTLDRVDFETVGQDGTAIGDGLGNALYRLGEQGAKSRIIVMLSDGENNSGYLLPADATRMARSRGVRVYTIAIGRPGGAPIPILDEFGRKSYLRNRDGSLVVPRMDETALKSIAERTGGHYFRATDPARLLQAYREIAQLERSRITVADQQPREDRTAWPLAIALLLLLAETFLRVGPASVLRLERRPG